jgi:hypothetical protein
MLYIHTHTHKSCSIWWIKSGSFGTLHALLGKLLNIRKTSSQNFGPQTGYPGVYCSIYTVPPRTRWGITSMQVTAASFTIHHSWSFRHRWCVGYFHYHLLLQRSWFVIRRRSHSQVILTADDTPWQRKRSVVMKHSRSAHVSVGTAMPYFADKNYQLSLKTFTNSRHKCSQKPIPLQSATSVTFMHIADQLKGYQWQSCRYVVD